MKPKTAPASFRVLIVDESHEIADLTALFFRICGYTTVVAYDGEEAFKLAKRVCPNAVVLAIDLPGMDGFELSRRLRRLPRPTKPLLIAQTWLDGIDNVRRAKNLGVDHYFVKPVDPREIVKVLAVIKPGV